MDPISINLLHSDEETVRSTVSFCPRSRISAAAAAAVFSPPRVSPRIVDQLADGFLLFPLSFASHPHASASIIPPPPLASASFDRPPLLLCSPQACS